MSLLEDVFLDDEAGEAQELERIIEGDEYDEGRPPDSDENSEREGEAEEDKRRVDPASTKAKRVSKNPRFVLNPARLTGPRGISVIPDHFKDFKFKGKGHEKEDLDLVLKKLEHWAYRLYPKFKFEDCLKKIETLGKKRVVSVHLHKIRSDQLITEDAVVQKDSSDEEELAVPLPEEDEFDQLLKQQIELAKATPRLGDTRHGFNTPDTPVMDKRSPLMTPMMPKATSSPSISDEQRERMIRNRRLAEERRLARLKAVNSTTNSSAESTVDLTNGFENRNGATGNENGIDVSNESVTKRNRSNVIDSSDDDNETINEAVIVDVHKTVNQDTVDLTEGYRQNTDTNKKDDSRFNNNTENNGCHLVLPAINIEVSQTDRNIVDLTNIQEGNSNSTTSKANKETGLFQNDDIEVNMTAAVVNRLAAKENLIDLTEIPIEHSISNVVDEIQQKSNKLDSSDDDDAHISVISESVTVEIHKCHRDPISVGSKTYTSESNENTAANTQKENSAITDIDNIPKTKLVENDIEFESTVIEAIINTAPQEYNNDNKSKTPDEEQDIYETEKCYTNKEKHLIESEGSTERNNSKDEDLDIMDVDFSEDF